MNDSHHGSLTLLQFAGNLTGKGVTQHFAWNNPFQNKNPIILKQTSKNPKRTTTLKRSSRESTTAPIIFLRPGSFDIDRSGLSTRQALIKERFGINGVIPKILRTRANGVLMQS